MIGEITEKMKTITTTVALIPDMQTQLTNLQLKVDTQLSDINARVLKNEEEINTLKQNQESNRTYLTTHIKPAIRKLEKGGLIDSLSTDLMGKIEKNENSLLELKTTLEDIKSSDLNRTVNYDLSNEDMKTIASFLCSDDNKDFSSPLQESIDKVEANVKKLLAANDDALSKRIHQLELQLNKKTADAKENRSNKPASNETLEHEAVFIGDSNTTEIDMATIGQNVKRKRFTCYTIPQTKQFLNTAKILKQPKKVLLHQRTNDVIYIKYSDKKQK